MPTKNEIQEFSLKIAELVESKAIGYMDAVITHCSETGLEFELASKLLSDGIKAKIRLEAEDLHFMKRQGRRLQL